MLAFTRSPPRLAEVIQVEAFNVFKVFVANPNKSERALGDALNTQSLHH